MSLLDEILAANAAVTNRADVPVPAVPDRCRVVSVTCGEIASPGGRALGQFLGLAPDETFVVANAGARVHAPDGDVVRSVAAALADRGGGEVFVVAHEDCSYLEADPESLAALLAGGFSTAINAVGALCGESFVSARKLALTSAHALRASPFLPRGTPVHALLFSTARGMLSAEEAGYDKVAAAGGTSPAAASFLSAPSPILGAPGPGPRSSFGAAGPVSLFGSSPSPLMGAVAPLMSMPQALTSGPAAFIAPPPPPLPPATAIPPMPSMPYVPPPAHVPPPAPLAEPLTFNEPPPAPEPPKPPPPKQKPHSGAGDDPFRRANEVLERLRRERRNR